MDPHRNLPDEFPSDSDDRWFEGERGYPEVARERRGAGEPRYRAGGDSGFDDRGYGEPDRFRVPEPRAAGPVHGGFDFDDEPRGGTRYADPAGSDLPARDGRPHPLVNDGPQSRSRSVGPDPTDRLVGSDPLDRLVGPDPQGVDDRGRDPRGADLWRGGGGDLRSAGPIPEVGNPGVGNLGVGNPAPRLRDEAVPRVPEQPLPPLRDEPPAAFRRDSPAPHGSAPHETGELPMLDSSSRHLTEPIDRSALRRPPTGPEPVGRGVYRSRRPGLAAVIIVVTVVLELPALRLVAKGLSEILPSHTISGSFLAVGLPMFGMGLYAVLTGAAAVAATPDQRLWLRSPLVYLPVGLALFLAAALAAT